MKPPLKPLTYLSLALGLTLAAQQPVFAAEQQKTERLPMEDVQRFTTAIAQIKSYYVKPVNDNKLFDDAIRGMLKSLDPHSDYLDPEDFKELRETTSGAFAGLGLEVTMESGVIRVIAPIDDSPAAKSGVKAGDYIIRLDEKPIEGMTLRDAVNLMRGKVGSTIKLTIIRKNEKQPLIITLTREQIRVKSVKSELLDNYYGYIRVSHFQDPTARDLLAAVAKLKKESNGKLKGLILDLRNNPGGLLDAAVQISDAFVHNDGKGKEEIIVYTKGRLPSTQLHANAEPGDVMDGAPMIVLINEGSASASEIVAGALKDNHRAIIMGKKSFGKGSVQTILPLDKDHGIKLTTALYYTPSGKSIQAEGIVPDIIIDDVNIAEAKPNNDLAALQFQESDLSGHLDNGKKLDQEATPDATITAPGTPNADKPEPQKKSGDGTKLMYKDYQLHEALNLLKALVLTKETQTKKQ